MTAENGFRDGPGVRIAHAPSDRARAITPYRFARVAREISRHVATTVPELENSAPGDPRREIAVVVRLCLDWSIERLGGAGLPEDTERLRAAFAGWADAGVGIDTVLHGVHEGFKAGMDLAFAQARPTTNHDVHATAAALMELLRLVTASVGMSYVRECRALAAEHHIAVHTLTSALLSGHSTSTMARTHGVLPADRYHVLAVSMPAHPDEGDARLNGQVVARRKLRRVQAALATRVNPRPLSLLSVDGGTILVPCTGSGATAVDDLVRELSTAAQVPLTAATVATETAGVANAVRQAHELLDTAQQLRRAPGVYRFADLALYYQLTRPGLGRDRLAGQLAVLDDHPELMETLRVHIATDLRRRVTAKLMHLHPNTVDYRLRRIGELTGLDPTDSNGLWYLHSAMVARASGASGEHPVVLDELERTGN